jgi:WD40 repeat protein
VQATGVAWDRRGKRLGLVCGDGKVRILDAATGEELARLKQPSADRVEFSSSGEACLLVEDWAAARWWEWAAKRSRTRKIKDAEEVVFSRNGRVFVSRASEGDAGVIRDGATGERLGGFRHKDGFQTLAVSPDGKLVLTACEAGRIAFWRTPKGAPFLEIQHASLAQFAAISPGCRYAATLGDDQVLCVWSLPDGAEIGRVRYERGVRTLEFSPDERMLLVASNNWAHLFRIDSGLAPFASRRLHGRWTNACRFVDKEGFRLLAVTAIGSAGYDAEVIRFDGVNAEPAAKASLAMWEARTALRFADEELAPAALVHAMARTRARAAAKPAQPATAGARADAEAVL